MHMFLFFVSIFPHLFFSRDTIRDVQKNDTPKHTARPNIGMNTPQTSIFDGDSYIQMSPNWPKTHFFPMLRCADVPNGYGSKSNQQGTAAFMFPSTRVPFWVALPLTHSQMATEVCASMNVSQLGLATAPAVALSVSGAALLTFARAPVGRASGVENECVGGGGGGLSCFFWELVGLFGNRHFRGVPLKSKTYFLDEFLGLLFLLVASQTQSVNFIKGSHERIPQTHGCVFFWSWYPLLLGFRGKGHPLQFRGLQPQKRHTWP